MMITTKHSVIIIIRQSDEKDKKKWLKFWKDLRKNLLST